MFLTRPEIRDSGILGPSVQKALTKNSPKSYSKSLFQQRDNLRLENEDSKRRQNTAKSNIAKLEKENARLKNDRDEAKKEFEDLTRKLRKLEQG